MSAVIMYFTLKHHTELIIAEVPQTVLFGNYFI